MKYENEDFQVGSDELLQKALIAFPMVLAPLLEKCKKSLQHPETRKPIQPQSESFFANCYSSPALEKLTSLFIDRCYSLWTSPSTQVWLSKNVAFVLKKYNENAKDEMFLSSLEKLQSAFPENATLAQVHTKAEYNDEVAALPAELLEQGFGQPQQAPQRVIPARTNNPLALLLQTLLPWFIFSAFPYKWCFTNIFNNLGTRYRMPPTRAKKDRMMPKVLL